MRLIFSLFLFVSAVLGQTSAGSITGTVSDPQQAPVAGVKVTAVNIATNVAEIVTTSSAGVYNLPSVEPGQYQITAEIAGFKKLSRGPVTVETTRVSTVDLKLEVGNVASEITVSANAPLVDDASSTVQYGIEQKVLDQLPLPNQAALGVLMTIPGVTGDPSTDEGQYHTGLITPGTGVSISGGRPGATQYQADGMTNTAIFRAASRFPSAATRCRRSQCRSTPITRSMDALAEESSTW